MYVKSESNFILKLNFRRLGHDISTFLFLLIGSQSANSHKFENIRLPKAILKSHFDMQLRGFLFLFLITKIIVKMKQDNRVCMRV